MAKNLNLKLHVWRQKNAADPGHFQDIQANGISTEMSFLEMLDVVNEDLIHKGEEPIVFDHDCREGICGTCNLVINGITAGQLEGWVREGVVEYLGEARDVRPVLAQAHVMVLPSYGEGTPRSVLEAMAMGRAVVTTDAPGCRETVVHERNGLVVPVGDAAALAAAMARLVRDPDLIGRYAAECRRVAERKYDVRLVTADIMAFMGCAPPTVLAAEPGIRDTGTEGSAPGRFREAP